MELAQTCNFEETERLLLAAKKKALNKTPTQLERFITRMCQINVDFVDQMWRAFYTLSVVAAC